MKILIFIWRDIKHPQAGGSEIYFHEISKKWVKKGNEVTWISGGWDGCKKEEIIDGVNIKRYGRQLSLYLYAPFAYLKLKNKPDVIIDVENGIPFFTPLYSRVKKIRHKHHITKDVWKEESKEASTKDRLLGIIGRFIESRITPFIYKNIKVITLSKSSRDEITKLEKVKVIGIVNPGIDFCKFKRTPRSKYPLVLFLNRIKKYKGVDTLLDAAKELKIKGLKILVAGSGDYLEKAKERVIRENVRTVKFLGRVSENKKKKLMQEAWIFVNPSFKEGWGIVNIEANYFGTPVIGSRVTGIMDSILDGKTGLLFEYGNHKELSKKLLYLLENKKELKRMSKESIKWAREFSYDKKADEYLKILRDFVKDK